MIGRGRASELLLTGRNVSASEALEIGLVDRVVRVSELPSEVRSTADLIKANAPLALRYCLEAVTGGLDSSLANGLEREAELFGACCATTDMREGTRAFLEKRAANFRGQ